MGALIGWLSLSLSVTCVRNFVGGGKKDKEKRTQRTVVVVVAFLMRVCVTRDCEQ